MEKTVLNNNKICKVLKLWQYSLDVDEIPLDLARKVYNRQF